MMTRAVIRVYWAPLVIELVVKIVNSIRGEALKTRFFREVMDKVDCRYGDLL